MISNVCCIRGRTERRWKKIIHYYIRPHWISLRWYNDFMWLRIGSMGLNSNTNCGTSYQVQVFMDKWKTVVFRISHANKIPFLNCTLAFNNTRTIQCLSLGSHSGIAEGSGVLRYDAVPLGEYFLKFRANLVPLPVGSSSQRRMTLNIKARCPKCPELLVHRHGVTRPKTWIIKSGLVIFLLWLLHFG
jgi:hypothetical protein